MIDPGTGWYLTPTSVKGVVIRRGEVLLCLNHRDEWELPGGWPSPGDDPLGGALLREVREETALRVAVGQLLLCELYAPVAGASVALVVFCAEAGGDAEPSTSSEHLATRFFAPGGVPSNTPDVHQRALHLALDGRGAAPRTWDRPSGSTVTVRSARPADVDAVMDLRRIAAENAHRPADTPCAVTALRGRDEERCWSPRRTRW